MKNSTMLKYVGSFIGTLIGMIIHINLMIETDEFIHFVCFFLWMIMSGCIVLILNHRMNKG